jgi:hypothetical protein
MAMSESRPLSPQFRENGIDSKLDSSRQPSEVYLFFISLSGKKRFVSLPIVVRSHRPTFQFFASRTSTGYYWDARATRDITKKKETRRPSAVGPTETDQFAFTARRDDIQLKGVNRSG